MSNTDERSTSSALRWGRPAALVAVVAALAAGAVAFAAEGGGTVQYRSAGGAYLTSVRPTGVGLPQIGESGTVGAGDLASSLRRYHDSGAYERDLRSVDGAAQSYLALRLKQAKAPTGKRVKLTGKPAVVLDIDETSLSNYEGLERSGFTAVGLAASSVVSRTPIKPTLSLYRYARSHGVAVFFVTGRPALIDAITKGNLRAAGYTNGWNALFERPAGAKTEAFKAGARQKIQRQGFDIVANVGDQESDLDGGHADRAFKLPDPFYFISD